MLCEPVLCGLVDVNGDVPVNQPRGNVLQSQADDLQDRLARQLIKNEHRVEAVEQFRREVLRRRVEDLLSRFGSDDAVLITCVWMRKNVASYRIYPVVVVLNRV